MSHQASMFVTGAALAALAHAAVAASAVHTTPFPVVANQDVTIQYKPQGRALDGQAQVYAHYGFNYWATTFENNAMSWNAGAGAWEITVPVAADAYQLDVVFHDGGGTWDNNNGTDWNIVVINPTTSHWTLDGQLDADATLIADNNGRQLYAGVRGSELYVATQSARDGNDHFIFLAETPGGLVAAPWDKSGVVAGWAAYIGNEVDNGWAGWFDNDVVTGVAGGDWLEGTINLAGEFGSTPTTIHLAVGAYPTGVGAGLQNALQVPASNDGDGDIDADEFVAVTVDAVRVSCSAADVNRDCDETPADLDAMIAALTGPVAAPSPGVTGDLDLDSDADLFDVAVLQMEYGPLPTSLAYVAEDLGPDATRFYPDRVTVGEMEPSLALVEDPNVYGPDPAPWPVAVSFHEAPGRHVAAISIPDDVSLYGTGEIMSELRRNGFTSETWATDAFAYGTSNESLYQSHPWVLGVRPDGTAFGVLADTTFRCKMDLVTGITFAAEGPEFPIYVFEGATPQDVLTRLTDFIGRIEMPPLWALGFQQSRYSYAPESYARYIANEFRNRDIPCDVLWFDIDYMDGFRVFTFDPTGFPDPSALNTDLHNLGYHSVWMIDPGVKVDSGYWVYDTGSAGNHWVLDAWDNVYTGEVWPGDCHFPDYTRPETRQWWADLFGPFMAKGIDGVWNDMNEPGIFDGPGHSMPIDCKHAGGGGLNPGTHNQYHNVYGYLMAKATHAGIKAANPDKRPFVLSRASFIGGHRHAAMWTGDNVANWEHFYYATPMVLNIGLSAQPFCGPDIGGFTGGGTGDLYARWIGVGVFMPFARVHYAGWDNADKEPWSFGSGVEATARTAIERRYRLIPYLYTLFEEAHRTGLPVARPMFFADPDDLSLRDENIAFMLGGDLIVAPNTYENPSYLPAPALPAGNWRRISLVGEDSSLDVNQPDLLIRQGAVLPLGPVEEYTGERNVDPLTLVINLDDSGYAEGWLYEDDGDGYDFETGDYRRARYTATQSGNTVTVAVAEIEGSRPTESRTVNIELYTDGGVIDASGVDVSSGNIVQIALP